MLLPDGCAMVRTSSNASCVFFRHASALLSLSQSICTRLTISFATAITLSWFSAWRICFQLISSILSKAYIFCEPVISTPSLYASRHRAASLESASCSAPSLNTYIITKSNRAEPLGMNLL